MNACFDISISAQAVQAPFDTALGRLLLGPLVWSSCYSDTKTIYNENCVCKLSRLSTPFDHFLVEKVENIWWHFHTWLVEAAITMVNQTWDVLQDYSSMYDVWKSILIGSKVTMRIRIAQGTHNALRTQIDFFQMQTGLLHFFLQIPWSE